MCEITTFRIIHARKRISLFEKHAFTWKWMESVEIQAAKILTGVLRKTTECFLTYLISKFICSELKKMFGKNFVKKAKTLPSVSNYFHQLGNVLDLVITA